MVVAIVIIAIIVLAVIVFVVLYNGLVQLRNRIDNAWSQIDVQLQRRHDLIPNLVETVKGYAAHERGTLEAVVQARNSAIAAKGPAEQAQAENVLSGALRQLFALSEAYPDLKANENFLNLQEEITSSEDRIAYRAAVLQRQRAEVQRQDPVDPLQPDRGHVELPRARVLRGRVRRTGSSTRSVLTAASRVRTDRIQQAA